MAESLIINSIVWTGNLVVYVESPMIERTRRIPQLRVLENQSKHTWRRHPERRRFRRFSRAVPQTLAALAALPLTTEPAYPPPPSPLPCPARPRKAFVDCRKWSRRVIDGSIDYVLVLRSTSLIAGTKPSCPLRPHAPMFDVVMTPPLSNTGVHTPEACTILQNGTYCTKRDYNNLNLCPTIESWNERCAWFNVH